MSSEIIEPEPHWNIKILMFSKRTLSESLSGVATTPTYYLIHVSPTDPRTPTRHSFLQTCRQQWAITGDALGVQGLGDSLYCRHDQERGRCSG